MKKFFERGKKLYWWLMGTFAMLYLAVAFVSTLHAITFFQLANTLGLAILLGAAYEIGQAAVLFSILMSQNRNRILAWGMMFLLTALQVTANVYASFKFMDASGSQDWTFWQRAILFGVEAEPETYKVIISWISGALLPIVALGMTALVADQIRLATGQVQPLEKKEEEDDEDDEPLFKNPFKRKNKDQVEADPVPEVEKEQLGKDVIQEVGKEVEKLSEVRKTIEDKKIPPLETDSIVLKEPKVLDLQDRPDNLLLDLELDQKDVMEGMKTMDPNLGPKEEEKIDVTQFKSPGVGLTDETVIPPSTIINIGEDIKPVNKMAGWHFMNEFVDNEHNVFHKGKYIGNDPVKTPTAKKA